MSQTLTPECRPAASPVLIAPRFTRSGLPQDAHEVKANLDRQKVDEQRFWNQAIQSAASCGQEATEPCTKTLHISLFFDGTNNHEPSDQNVNPRCTSNIARLYHATIDHGVKEAAEAGYYRYYIPGVGTVFKEIHESVPLTDGLKGAEGGENRINWGLVRLIDALKLTLTPKEPLSDEAAYALVDKMSTCWYGHVFSGTLLERGDKKRIATLTPELEKLSQLLEQRRQQQQKPEILALRLYVYGFSRGAAEARTFANWLADLTRSSTEGGEEYRFAGLPISIEFLGLFDTVAAVGIADSAPFAAGHMDWADGTMRLPDESATQPTTLVEDRRFLKRCVHLVSAHEQRASFPLDSIRRRARLADGLLEENSSYRAGTVEYVYPGMHSDVGGGYPPGDQGKAMGGEGELMSQLPLHHMYSEAFAAGAPLQVPNEVLGGNKAWRAMTQDTFLEFGYKDVLINRFNAWQSQAQKKSGPLEDVVKHETALITGWRIDRYAGGVGKTSFYGAIQDADETQEVWDAKRRLHAHLHTEAARKSKGIKETSCANRLAAGRTAGEGDCPGYSAGESMELASPGKRFCFDEDFQLVGRDKYEKLNTNKTYEPPLDRRQLRRAADEFRRDYEKSWEMGEDTLSFGGILNIALGGLVYLINEEDEAEEYKEIWDQGTLEYRQLFTQSNQITPGKEDLVKLFDDHVHDSRAWFMNSSVVAEREPFTDYFRHRLVHFDDQSNKRLSLLAKTGRVVGVGIALASIGLTIKRRDPRYLLGLSLPSLAIPVLRGKVGFPEISAFDPLTGLALPMQAGLEAVRTFSKDTGSLNKLVDSLPAPVELTEQTATTPELKKIFQAVQAAKAVADAKEGNPMGLVDMLAGQGDTEQSDRTKSPGWFEMAGDLASSKLGIN